ncbi:MAG: 2TM domain-containing protein [Agriterribacter sp.]
MTHITNRYAATTIDQKKGFSIHLLVFLLTIPALWLVWFLVDGNYPWPAWNTLAWAIGLLFHYLGVYVFKKPKTRSAL